MTEPERSRLVRDSRRRAGGVLRPPPLRTGQLDHWRRRLAARRCRRGGDGVHRQGRRRPGQLHRAATPGRRGAWRPAGERSPGHGRHRSVPLRHGHLRQSVHARRRQRLARGGGLRANAAARGRRVSPPRDRHRRARAGRSTQWRIAGKTHVPEGMVDAVTGSRRFMSDLAYPGLRYGVVVRPPVVGATLRHVDTSALEGRDDIDVVQTHKVTGVVAGDVATARRALTALRAQWSMPDAPSEMGLEAFFAHTRRPRAAAGAGRGGARRARRPRRGPRGPERFEAGQHTPRPTSRRPRSRRTLRWPLGRRRPPDDLGRDPDALRDRAQVAAS